MKTIAVVGVAFIIAILFLRHPTFAQEESILKNVTEATLSENVTEAVLKNVTEASVLKNVTEVPIPKNVTDKWIPENVTEAIPEATSVNISHDSKPNATEKPQLGEARWSENGTTIVGDKRRLSKLRAALEPCEADTNSKRISGNMV